MTTCLICCWSFCWNITDLLRHGLYKTLAVSCCFWHQYFSSRSFTSCRLRGGATCGSNLLVWHILQMLSWIEIWGIWRPEQHLGFSNLSRPTPTKKKSCPVPIIRKNIQSHLNPSRMTPIPSHSRVVFFWPESVSQRRTSAQKEPLV